MLQVDNPTNTAIVADWGTSRLRVMLCDGQRVIAQRHGPGIAAVAAANQTPEEVFANVAGQWLDQFGANGVTLCGMAGSNIGWVEAPYIECPADLSQLAAACVRFTTRSASFAIIPGMTCVNHLGAPDVMRGEETQILGALELHPSLRAGRHVLCLPGTHSKWVDLEDGVVDRFSTSPTGEFFAVLGERSVLAHAASETAVDPVAFDHGGVRSLTSHPASMPFVLFEARSRTLREGMAKAAAREFLSGLLIGAEIKAAKDIILGGDTRNREVVFIGDPGMTERYMRAYALAHGRPHAIDGGASALAGLLAVRRAAAEV